MARRLPWVLLLALSAVLHLAVLGQRSFHHDEAIHAKGAWDLAESGLYHYDPTYHGPLLYMLTAATFRLAGDTDFTARLPIALAGIALIWVAWALRRPLGERAAWWTGLLATISPITLYYGRFLRMDVLELVLASAAAVAGWRAVRGRRSTWGWFGLWAGLAFATKENAYVTAVLVAAVAAAMAAGTGLRRALPAAATWALRERWGIVTAVAVAATAATLLYTVGFHHPGDWFFPGRAVSYWWGQHHAQRVAGPWWYHLPRLAQYEFFPILAALAWALRRRARLGRLEASLLLFGLASVGMYAYLGEKVPWLGVHQVWAFLPLAGLQLGRTFGPRGRWWSRSLAAAGLAATAAISLSASFLTDEISPDLARVETLVYVQTCPEVKGVVAEGRAAAATGADPAAAVAGEAGWPLSWYWRSAIQVWWSMPKPGMRPPLVLVDPDQEAEARRILGPGYEAQKVPLRAWWLLEGSDPSPGDILRYLVTRRPWSAIGATEMVILRRVGDERAAPREAQLPTSLAGALGATDARVLGEGWLVEPRGLAVAADGTLAVADVGLSSVVLIGPDGSRLERGVPDELEQPEAVAWTPSGVLAVADTWHHRVVLANLAQDKAANAPEPPGGWYGPRAVSAAADGTLAVADTGNKRVVVLSHGGGRVQVWDAAGAGGLVEPVGLAWLPDGRLLVCDTGNRRLVVFDRGGGVSSTVALPDAWREFYSRPQAAVLAADLWLVTDPPASALWLVRPAGVERIDLASSGIVPGGIAWRDGSLWLSDLGGRVWHFQLSAPP